MFDRLKDKINMYGGKPKWKQLIEIFEIKYQKVRVHQSEVDDSVPPEIFYVLRNFDGEYVVIVEKRKEILIEALRSFSRSENSENKVVSYNAGVAKELIAEVGGGRLWIDRTKDKTGDIVIESARLKEYTLINWGIFDYKNRGGVGECFEAGWPNGRSFFFNFIHVGDQDRFKRK